MFYAGTVQMRMSVEQFMLCPLGLFLDLWAAHLQFLGYAKPKVEVFADQILFAESN